MSEDRVTISIPKRLYELAERFIEENGGFSSVEELVEFVLSEALGEEEGGEVYSEEDKRVIEDRLRSLGYL